MKILMVTADGFPHTGGVEKHIHMVSKEMVKLGHKVDVVLLSTTKMKPFVKDGVKYKPFKALFSNTHLFNIDYVLYVLKNANKYDIIHFQGLHKPLPVFMLFMLQNKKVGKVFTTHYHGGGHSIIANAAHVVYTPLVSPVLKNLDAVIAVSGFEKNVLQASFPEIHERTHVIYNGVESHKCANEQSKNEGLQILFVSRLERYKNIQKVLWHIPEGSTVHIVGDGSYRKTLQEVAFKNPKINTVFHGKISDSELCELWKQSDVYVNMSSKEAYGVTLVEALTHGTPVICSNIPAFVEVKKITKSKNIHPIDNLRYLGRLVKRVESKGFVEDNMALPGWSEAAAATVKIYRQIIGRTK